MNSIKTILLILLLIFAVGLGCKKGSLFKADNGKIFTIEIMANAGENDIVEQAVKVTEAKLRALRLDGEVSKDPSGQNRMLVKIYGSDDLEKAKKFLFTTHQLELKEVVSLPNPRPMSVYPTQTDAENAVGAGQEALKVNNRNSNETSFVIVTKEPIVTGEDVRDAQAINRGGGEDYQIAFSLKPDGAQKFGDWTGKNIGAYLGIVLDKKLISAPFIKGQILDSGQIDGKFTKEEADDIALSLKSGYLPATMKIVKEEEFGN